MVVCHIFITYVAHLRKDFVTLHLLIESAVTQITCVVLKIC